jgi:putative DNA primase/helicase
MAGAPPEPASTTAHLAEAVSDEDVSPTPAIHGSRRIDRAHAASVPDCPTASEVVFRQEDRPRRDRHDRPFAFGAPIHRMAGAEVMTNDEPTPPPSTTPDLSPEPLIEPARPLRLVVSNGPVLAKVKEVPASAAQIGSGLADLVAAFTKLPSWHHVVGWNEFTHRMVFRREPPLRNGGSRLGEALVEEDVVRVRHWFEVEHGVKVSGKNVLDALQMVARQNRFHPVRDYLSSLSWDGQLRVDTWLEDFCSVQPTSPDHQRLIRAVAQKWLVSCVARAMTPGCKVDTILILEGKQGVGKSTALRALAGEAFFCDGLIDFGGKDACQNIQGTWIYELAELDALLRGDSGSTKAFLSRPSDKFRPPYGRTPVTVPRSVVFCGSVNHSGYLKDHSGNRRFWVVKCGESLNVDGIKASRDQLWAEARHLFDQGQVWHLSADEEALMREQHEDRMESEPFEEAVASWIVKQGETPIAIDAVLENALGMKAASRNPNVTRRVHHILERLGFERQRRAFDGPGRRVYRYVRLPAEPCPPGPTALLPPGEDAASAAPEHEPPR